ncbi:MAG: hypothetical protein HWN65_10725 [Candidatus Helarchaeota archaeon]|nr:hypothetical protein [Candidatus Helarchaeota archaeon]
MDCLKSPFSSPSEFSRQLELPRAILWVDFLKQQSQGGRVYFDSRIHPAGDSEKIGACCDQINLIFLLIYNLFNDVIIAGE